MKTRIYRLAMAVGLLAVVWPPVAHLIGTALTAVTGLTATHPTAAVTAAACLLLAGTVPGPVDRVLTRLTSK